MELLLNIRVLDAEVTLDRSLLLVEDLNTTQLSMTTQLAATFFVDSRTFDSYC